MDGATGATLGGISITLLHPQSRALSTKPVPALAALCRRRYARAIQLLLTAATAPTMVLNAITVACLKKLILVSLLHTGGWD